MNDKRRKTLSSAIGTLEDVKATVDACQLDEQEAFNAMPKGRQNSKEGEKVERNAEVLYDSLEYIGDAINLIKKAIE